MRGRCTQANDTCESLFPATEVLDRARNADWGDGAVDGTLAILQ